MEVFGEQWAGHFERICQDWRDRVRDADIVLIPGDISWAMRIDAAMPDLAAIGALPGKKVLLRGNHDYWWCGISRLRQTLPEGMYAVQNDALALPGAVVCGTRGWVAGGDDEDAHIYRRELLRLEMSLQTARKRAVDAPLIVMTHFPPLFEDGADTDVTRLIAKYRASAVVYGHLHGAALKSAFNGMKDGIPYACVSCDGLGFMLHELTL